MIRLRGVSLSRGGRTLIEGADLSLSPGERIALVGANGSGKTTLLAALAGELAPDRGDIEQPWRRVTWLEQTPPASELPAWQHVLAGDLELTAAQQALEHAQAGDDGIAIAEAHDRWSELDAHGAAARSQALLAGLGFSPEQAARPVNELSGGWRMRLNLARALFVRSELLMLDEPTNHLDLDAVLWLERWLTRYPGTAIVVSHDRDFLDRVATATVHIDEGKLVRYAGGYSEFERLRAVYALQGERQRASDAARIAHLQHFIDRFRAKATKARQAQSRMKALERMKEVAPIRALRGVDIQLHEVGESPDPMLVAEELSAGYGEQAIVSGANLSVRRGARIGILGRNGAGKSTLIRTLVGELTPLAGEVSVSRALRIGFFAQEAVDRLDPRSSALDHLRRREPQTREQSLRDVLGSFGFSGEDATRPVGPMSGGEKARLALALMLRDAPQLLVLDEPTNHLDALTRDALADALAEFDGALLLVSHDRYLLRASVDTLQVVRDGQLQPFDGDLDDYAESLLRPGASASGSGTVTPAVSDSSPAAATAGASGTEFDRRAQRRLAAEQRARLNSTLAPLEASIRALETELASITQRLEEIDEALGAADAYDRPEQAAELGRERARLSERRETAELQWLENATQRDEIRDAHSLALR